MDVTTRTQGTMMIASVNAARIDAAAAVQFRDVMQAATADAPSRVVLDLAQVTFLDSSGLGAVIGTMKRIAPDRRLELAALNPAVAKVFRLTCLDTIFVIHESADAALASEVPDGRAHAC
ncbi:STAS domain-containing protein [Profundibacterium mesophilum]|nr:STAS domain-containing protein [Profundibacterium mesophilum]